jgi:hypothetical protein
MLPLEIFTFLGGTLIGGIKSIIMLKIKKGAQIREAELLAMNSRAQIRKEIREHGDDGFRITRRIIALTLTFCVILLPFVAPYLSMFSYLFADFPFPAIPVTFGYTQLDPGLWPFTSDVNLTKWVSFDTGFVITPFHTHMLSAISGFYFGERQKN